MLSYNQVLRKELFKSFPTVQESGQSEQYSMSYALGQIMAERLHAIHMVMKPPLVHGAQGTVVKEKDLACGRERSWVQIPAVAKSAPYPILNHISQCARA